MHGLMRRWPLTFSQNQPFPMHTQHHTPQLLSCRPFYSRTTLSRDGRPAIMSRGAGDGTGGSAGKERVSRLCKPLWNCLHSEQSPLSVLEYLIQFMAAKDALHLLQFWFSVTSFRNAASSLTTDSNRPPMSPPLPTSLGGGGEDEGRHRQRCPASDEYVEAEWAGDLSENLPDAGNCTVLGGPRVWSEAGDRGGMMSGGNGEGVRLGNGGVKDGGDVVVAATGDSCTTATDITRQLSLNVVSDAMGIYTTYVALNALTPVHVPDNIRQRVEVSICPEDGIVCRTCFDEAQEFVYKIMEQRYYPQFLRSLYLCKYQLELVSSGQLCLLDFLLGGDSLGYFMEFMEAEAALPLLQFWLAAESFHENVSAALRASHHDKQRATSSEESLEDAISIYERYFSLQATQPLGMGDGVRIEIETRICNERGPRQDSYLPAQLIAYDTMNEKYYPHFLESGPYLKFLHTLLAVVKSAPDDGESAKPTATITAGPATTTQSETEGLPLFPAYDLDDPESLWRRPQLLMRLGWVDGMGQYSSQIDPFPTKTSRSKDQPRHFRQFKNRQEEEEWEYAVKVSRSIVAKILKRTSRTSFRK